MLVGHAPTLTRPTSSAEAVSRLGLSARQVGALANDLQQYFEQTKPYLDPRLDLSHVAASTGYTRNQISFFLNQVRGQTFYTLLNQLRLDEALSRLNAQRHASRIDEIATPQALIRCPRSTVASSKKQGVRLRPICSNCLVPIKVFTFAPGICLE